MAENLFLRLCRPVPAEAPQPGEAQQEWIPRLEWMLLDETSGIVRFKGEGALSEFAALREQLTFGGRTYLMIQGEDVLLTNAVVPSKQVRQILQAVPYVIEEQLACDVESCHFSIGARTETGLVSVAVIDKSLMTDWASLLSELDVSPTVLTTDLLALPAVDHCHVFVDGERALIRSGGNEGLCVATDMIATTISLLPEEHRQSVQLTLAPEQETELQLTIGQISAESDISVETTLMEYSPFETLARGFNLSAINLLQGDFKVESHDKTEKSAWRSVAIWAGCAFLLHLFVVMGQAVYLDVQARQLDAEARALYASIYPNDRNVRDMRRRWQNHLRSSGGGATGEFMNLFVETTKHIPGANLNLDNLSYNESRGDLVLQLEAGRSEQLIGFAETLNKMGLEAEIGTINQSDDSVRGSVKVKMIGES